MNDTPLSYPSLLVLEPRGRGRPKAKELAEEIMTRVPAGERVAFLLTYQTA